MKLIRISADRETLQQLFDQLAPLYFPLQKELMLAIVDDMRRHDESWKDIEKYLPYDEWLEREKQTRKQTHYPI